MNRQKSLPSSERAYQVWKRKYPFPEMDRFIAPFVLSPFTNKQLVSNILAQKTRRALYLSSGEMARRMKISPQCYHQLEKSELKESLQIGQLKRMAEAMDCELIYALKPKSNQVFSKVLWDQLYKIVQEHPWSRHQRIRADLHIVEYNFARFLLKNASIRKKMGWTQRIRDDEGASIPF
jgi:DNA-binding XRE family transcriptional regulator